MNFLGINRKTQLMMYFIETKKGKAFIFKTFPSKLRNLLHFS